MLVCLFDKRIISSDDRQKLWWKVKNKTNTSYSGEDLIQVVGQGFFFLLAPLFYAVFVVSSVVIFPSGRLTS